MYTIKAQTVLCQSHMHLDEGFLVVSVCWIA